MLRIFLFIAVLALISVTDADAEERSDSTLKAGRNRILGNISFLDININYERTIFQWPRSYTNIRAGLGYLNDLQGGGRECGATMINALAIGIGAKF
jgi:hypothetical protein